MADKTTALFCLEALKKAGAEKAQCSLVETEKHELNVDAGELSLVRTGFNTEIRFTAIKDGRRGTASLNGSEEEGIKAAAGQAAANAAASPADPAYDIAPAQPARTFEAGAAAPDLGLMYDRLAALLAHAKAKHPKLNLRQVILNFTRRKEHFVNSNGVDFSSSTGFYDGFVFFSSKDGQKISSFNYSMFEARGLEKELADMALTDELFRQSGEQLEPRPLSGKFTGDIVVTPHAMNMFMYFLTAQALRDAALISGSSPYKDKIGQRVASPGFTLRSLPVSPDMAGGYFITPDGYAAENLTLIEDGVLKTFVLGQYGANKTGLPRVSNVCDCDVVEPGDRTLQELVAPIKRGLLVARVSGNNPTEGGDFSGVAKNSYYVENGKILHPVSETMISCNIPKLLMNINGISKERVHFGNAVFPWVSFGGVTISGK